MKIEGGTGGPLRPDRSREVSIQPIDPRERDGKRTPSQVEKYDRVEISDAGRAKSARLEPTSSGTRDRLAEVRLRVISGAYHADAVVGEVARRIIDRGDV
ncbi:MAG: flagellar biosynthesis anti-sigma factor FlgM [Gemmatimonadota bacterium]